MAELQKIACVEDDKDIRSIVELALSDLGGMDVSLYCNGVDALERMGDTDPQLILLDVMMPGMDGLETLERLRTRPSTQETPVIFMTAKAQPAELTRFLNAGAIGVITKPFDPMTLADEVRNLWAAA